MKLLAEFPGKTQGYRENFPRNEVLKFNLKFKKLQKKKPQKKTPKMQDNFIKCDCNPAFPAIVRTVKKGGPTQGREFYTCGNKDTKQNCGFFRWLDEDQDCPPPPKKRKSEPLTQKDTPYQSWTKKNKIPENKAPQAEEKSEKKEEVFETDFITAKNYKLELENARLKSIVLSNLFDRLEKLEKDVESRITTLEKKINPKKGPSFLRDIPPEPESDDTEFADNN